MEILQILADVFNCSVYAITDTTNSACLGGVYRAKYSLSEEASFENVVKDVMPFKKIASPRTEFREIYEELARRYAELEKQVPESR